LEDTSDNEDIPAIRSRLNQLDAADRTTGRAPVEEEETSSSTELSQERRWDWLSSLCHYPESLLATSPEPLTHKVALDKLFESVEKVFESGASAACSAAKSSSEPTEPAPVPSPSRSLAQLPPVGGPASPSRSKPKHGSPSPNRKDISSPRNTPTRTRGRNLDDFDANSYDGELNFDPRVRAVLPRPRKRKEDTLSGKQNQSHSTNTTATSSRSASQAIHRKGGDMFRKGKATRKPLAALKGLFRRKKQYHV
jgi:hypothetical protein